MRLSVTIPRNETSPFTLYAEGKVFYRYDYPAAYRFEFVENSVIILFYHFPHFRRAYIVCRNGHLQSEPQNLPNVSEPVCILASFTARKFDQLKNTVYHLGQVFPDFALLPPPFFFRLALLVDAGKNSGYLVDGLLKGYTGQTNGTNLL
ncbi:hypothetical protein FACS189473_2060 [Spirochaetia bacterium]|nr:hypothetical protein FACS189473_2060 [Spirochaetia bacterium]